MPPYQQNYQETFEIESKNKPRDINILNQIFKFLNNSLISYRLNCIHNYTPFFFYIE